MLMGDAMKAIEGKPRGFRVNFERVEGQFLLGDHFPERGEPLIESEEEAWELAGKFAAKTVGKCVNIYVVDETWHPVRGYETRKIVNRS